MRVFPYHWEESESLRALEYLLNPILSLLPAGVNDCVRRKIVYKVGLLDGSAGLDMCLFMSRYEREISRRFSEYRRFRNIPG